MGVHSEKYVSGLAVVIGKVPQKIFDSPGVPNRPALSIFFFRQFKYSRKLTRNAMNWTIEESQIVKAVLYGDVDEFQILVERYQRPIYNLMLRITRTVMTAEDLTQDVFERAYAKLHTFKSGKRFFPWLYSIAINTARDHLRKKGIRGKLFQISSENIELKAEAPGYTAAHMDHAMDVRRVSESIDQLPLIYSEPLLLYYREGFSVKEISEVLDISVPSVKVRIYRGRELIKKEIGV